MRRRRGRLVLITCGVAVLLPIGGCGLSRYQDSGATGASGVVSPAPAATSLLGIGPSTAAGEETDTSTWKTRWGPLSAADRELMAKVRLATLWEMVMAQQAMQRGNSARIREISAMIAAQHQVLDQEVRTLAAKLKVELPVKPTDLQQEWMSDISGRSGKEYDATYVKWLRLAHGQVFALIGTVRGSTQNTLIRRFSEHANAAVLNHQRMLESTGLTTPDAFPTPPAAS
jgi:predicted outer membrane protein